MKAFYNFLVFQICLTIAAYLLPLFMDLPAYTPLSSGPTDIISGFTVEVFSQWAIGGSIIGVAAYLLHIGVYGVYALVIWSIGILLNPVRNAILAVPILINAVLPPETNVLYPAANPISLAIEAIFVFTGFIFLMELVTQRNVS